MKTRTFVLSGDAVDDFDIVLAIQNAATKYGCSFEGDVTGDKIERCVELEQFRSEVIYLATSLTLGPI